MPEEHISNNGKDVELAVMLGRLIGSADAMQTQMQNMHQDQGKIWEKVEETNVAVTVLAATLKAHMEEEEDRIEALERNVGGTTTKEYRKKKRSQWDLPMGEFLFGILMQALKLVGVGVIIALIIMGFTDVNLK